MARMTEDPLRGRIDFDGTRTPLKTALFVVVCLAWLLPGLVGHDPWKLDEAVAFGAVAEMLGTGDWVRFRLAGEPLPGLAPLFLWTAAAFAKVLGGVLALHDAARLAAGFYVALTLYLLAIASRELLGERAMRMSVLLFIGCLGLLIRAHEMTPDLAGLAGIALTLHGLALCLRRAVAGGALAGLGIGIAFLGDGFLPVAMLLLLGAMLPMVAAPWRTRRYAATAGIALACAAPLVALWPALLSAAGPEALSQWLVEGAGWRWGDAFGQGTSLGIVYFLKLLPWYAWPALPLAAWTIWRSRHALGRRPELQVPIVAFAAFFLVAAVFGESRDVNAMPLLLPLAILGVAELDTLPRGAASALDWFGMTTFFLFAAMLWLGWLAAITGRPDFASEWLQKEVPGFTYRFNYLAVALATLLTLTWLAVVARSLRSTRRAVVNWAAGITMVWMLVMTLGVPLVDQARSYRGVAARLALALPRDGTCIARHQVGDAQRALFDYFAGVRTVPMSSPAAHGCGTLLVQAAPLRAPAVGAGWSELWRGTRPGDRNEVFILYRRAGDGSPVPAG